MQLAAHVLELWRYPVSSLGGERLDRVELDPAGVQGDRRFGVVDAETGRIASPDRDRRWRSLPRIPARLKDGTAEIAADGAGWTVVPGEAADRALSARLGFAASVRAYDAPAQGGPVAVNRYRPSPVHLLSTASLARLKALHPAGDPDPRRFRPNIVIAMPEMEGAFPETEWIGRWLRVGALTLRIAEPCRRCGFTILAQDGLEEDPGILRQLVRHNGHNIGVYCEVEGAGSVSVGDAVALL